MLNQHLFILSTLLSILYPSNKENYAKNALVLSRREKKFAETNNKINIKLWKLKDKQSIS